MHILVVGLNHKTAPVKWREQFTFSNEQLQQAVKALCGMRSIFECVMISTCNRTEVYMVCDQVHAGECHFKFFLENWCQIPRERFSSYFYVKEGMKAIHHLFEVVCGLDSLVVGETQILGQVRKAFLIAQSSGGTGTLLNTLFRQAITLGKEVHAKTAIGRNAVSVSSAAVELGKRILGTFEGKTVLLIGVGEMSTLAAKHFYTLGATRILVVHRDTSRAQELAQKVGGQAHSWDRLGLSLCEADMVLSATSSVTPVITRSLVEPILHKRTSPLCFIDIAVPRDVDPNIANLSQVALYNVDDLQAIVDMNRHLRLQEIQKIQVRIEKAKTDFREWYHTLDAIPLICALQKKAKMIQEQAMSRIERKLPDLSERQKKVILKQTKSIVNQLLRDPIIRIKECTAHPSKDPILKSFPYIFALEEELDGADPVYEVRQMFVQ